MAQTENTQNSGGAKNTIIILLLLLLLLAIGLACYFYYQEESEKAELNAFRHTSEEQLAAFKLTAERHCSDFLADSVEKAIEQREFFIKDSLSKECIAHVVDSLTANKARAAFVADSIRKANEKPKVVEKKAPEKKVAEKKIELYWIPTKDETNKILFKKLSPAGLNTGICTGNGIKVSVSRPFCTENETGVVKCSYNPQLLIAPCDGPTIVKLPYGTTFGGSQKDEELGSRQRMLDELQRANFDVWIERLKSLKK
jgi:hypothetical protein